MFEHLDTQFFCHSQSQAELDLCKTKYETETVHKVEDLEVQLSRAQVYIYRGFRDSTL